MIVLTQDKFYVYKDRMECEHEVDLDGITILCCAFNYDSNEAYFGDAKGKIRTWNLVTGH